MRKQVICVIVLGICMIISHSALADDISSLDGTRNSSTTPDNIAESTHDKGSVDEWYLQLENLLFQGNPSVAEVEAAINGLQGLYKQLLAALPAPTATRRLNQPVHQAHKADEEGGNTKPRVTTALADATLVLAVLAATGIASPHVAMNDSWAVKALHVAAQGGSAQADLALAHRYFMADGVPGNCQEGLRRARAVADEYLVATQGRTSPELPLDPVSLRLRHMHGSYETLASEDTWAQLQLEADMLDFGDAFQRMLGYGQLGGVDMEADAAAALQHFQEAAGQGDPYAAFNLGYMHMRGVGTPPNATAAKAYFEDAARHGLPSAYNGLGVLHYEGQAGAPVDYVAARQAFETGALLGDPDAMFNLGTIYAGGHGVETNHSLAHEHYLDAHDAGHWRAPHALAITHQRGWGVAANCTKAQQYIQTFIKERSTWADQMDEAVLALDAGNEWLALLQYAVVAVQGSSVAQANLAWLLERSSRYDVQHKTKVCLRLLTQAGKGGFADAWVDAGNLEYRGRHLEEAGRLYGVAAKAGSIEGMYSLGWMHAQGLGVAPNTSRAAALYRQAIRRAPDWQHAAPPFIALLLLPGLRALQALHPFLPSGFWVTGEAWSQIHATVGKQTSLRCSQVEHSVPLL
ncbi:hypothetical protein ABBQ32_011809 [Trebouxia sp. C0010 RCD-2024]